MIVRILREMGVLALLALVPAVISAMTLVDLREAGFASAADARLGYRAKMQKYEVTAQEVRTWRRVIWVDARSRASYDAGHIPDAVLLNLKEWDHLIGPFLEVQKPDLPTVVYCESSRCGVSYVVAGRLRAEFGFDNVFVLKGGWEAWAAHR